MLETRKIEITLTDEVWKTLEAKAIKEDSTIEEYIKHLLEYDYVGLI